MGSVTAVWGKGAVVATLAFIVALVPALSDATLVGHCSGPLENLGQCNMTVTYDSTTNKLTITLKNTSPADNGGFLTADAFDLDPGAPASPDIEVLSFTGDAVFTAFSLFPAAPSTGGSIPIPPFSLQREFVISIAGGDWAQEADPLVSPLTGIPVGGSATFTLTLSDDISELSLFGINGQVIRFRGFADGGSDKTLTTVPEPGTLLLLGSALVGIGAWSRQRRLGRRDS
jgi:PEP-CTERM motif